MDADEAKGPACACMHTHMHAHTHVCTRALSSMADQEESESEGVTERLCQRPEGDRGYAEGIHRAGEGHPGAPGPATSQKWPHSQASQRRGRKPGKPTGQRCVWGGGRGLALFVTLDLQERTVPGGLVPGQVASLGLGSPGHGGALMPLPGPLTAF